MNEWSSGGLAEREPERRARPSTIGAVLECECAAVAFSDLSAQGETDARSSRLRREERHEQVAGALKPRPFILDANDQHTVLRRPARSDAAPGFERSIGRVAQQVDQ